MLSRKDYIAFLAQLPSAERAPIGEAQWENLFASYFCASEEERGRMREEAAERAKTLREACFGSAVYLRGLIEYSSYCENDCYYCGLRRSNRRAQRYRLSEEQVYESCSLAYRLGLRTFVLQGGENSCDDRTLPGIIRTMRRRWPEAAITLSLGEKEEEVYRSFKEAGADRYLLRHETADAEHYETLHPKTLSLRRRMECLRTLRRLGFQAGCGFMVGSPGQSARSLAKDFVFIENLKPHMCGIGPFIPQKDTPFAGKEAGAVDLTLFCLALIRLLSPAVLLPATTALATRASNGYLEGLRHGANVIMPNMTPVKERRQYQLYDGKVNRDKQAQEGFASLCALLDAHGYVVGQTRGDHPAMREKNEEM